MKKDKKMVELATKTLLERGFLPASDRLLFVEDLPEEQNGLLIVAPEAQSAPHSGIVVAVGPGIDDSMIGTRVYYRPYTEHSFNLGPDSLKCIVSSLHKKDIQGVEGSPK